ncbi:CxxH/CxxC protein [Indiicoccus explosivorum]|uniref:CxxH/CxxC protein n=1 Tax=Indiicoccus explosivorum TaxID=1917864 RepID=UPI000B444BD8|nr:CxxH/CxxC protein [Indiicoccus explosivorum]
MKKKCCKTHVDRALDEVTAKTGSFPILTELSEDEKLSTRCEYCEAAAIYLVADK